MEDIQDGNGGLHVYSFQWHPTHCQQEDYGQRTFSSCDSRSQSAGWSTFGNRCDIGVQRGGISQIDQLLG
nr:unnamed protein product [Callosobruchus analis]